MGQNAAPQWASAAGLMAFGVAVLVMLDSGVLSTDRGPLKTDTVQAGMPRPAPTIEVVAQPPLFWPTDLDAAEESMGTTAHFRVVSFASALEAMGGHLLGLEGMEPERVEVGLGRNVPMALPNAAVIRSVYTRPDGSLLLLDQQRLPDTVNLGRVGMAPGDTLISSADNGVTVAMWLASRTLRLSLAGEVDADTMRSLVARVR